MPNLVALVAWYRKEIPVEERRGQRGSRLNLARKIGLPLIRILVSQAENKP